MTVVSGSNRSSEPPCFLRGQRANVSSKEVTLITRRSRSRGEDFKPVNGSSGTGCQQCSHEDTASLQSGRVYHETSSPVVVS